MHITHGKAGSTWIDLILRALFGKQVAPRMYELPQRFAFEKYKVYSAVFITRTQFLSYPDLAHIKRFVVLRDLRDTLISQYFSMRDTHELDSRGTVATRRAVLRSCGFEEGLGWLLENALHNQAEMQRSWIGSSEIILKYEDLLARDLELFETLLLVTFALPISPEALRTAVMRNRFENIFQRKLGQKDATSHGRQGAPGDWRNYFTRSFARQFDKKYGDLLIAAGYEMDRGWLDRVA